MREWESERESERVRERDRGCRILHRATIGRTAWACLHGIGDGSCKVVMHAYWCMLIDACLLMHTGDACLLTHAYWCMLIDACLLMLAYWCMLTDACLLMHTGDACLLMHAGDACLLMHGAITWCTTVMCSDIWWCMVMHSDAWLSQWCMVYHSDAWCTTVMHSDGVYLVMVFLQFMASRVISRVSHSGSYACSEFTAFPRCTYGISTVYI